MKPQRQLNPRRLDVAPFCEHEHLLDGHWHLADMQRLLDGSVPDANVPELAPEVAWQAQGHTKRRVGAQPEHRLRLRVQATVWRQCQRCLQPVALALEVDREFLFAANEEAAAKLDDERDDEDVLVLSRQFDLQTLVEDELLLALPIVPMHDACPVALKVSCQVNEPEQAPSPNPFAALAALKKH
jgi:uncharacterized protein